MELFNKSIKELHSKLVSRELSATELTTAVLARVEEAEPKVQAYITLTAEKALAQAAKVDKDIASGKQISPLAGIPAAIKDNICTEGIKTTCASKMLADFVPPYDATVMQKLYAQDFVMVGKTNMDEFAMGSSTETSAFHKTFNPWDLNTVPGGSSGGSAAAVSAGEAIWSLGSDTGGSIRQPAAFTGIVGLKPTYGLVSRYGLVAFASSLDQIGPITRNVEDAAIVLNAIAGHDKMESTSIDMQLPDYTSALNSSIKGMKFGLPKEYFAKGLDAKVGEVVKKAVQDIEKLGGEIVEISLPHTEYAVTTYYIIAPAEASSNLARYDGVGYGYRSQNGKNLVEMTTNSRTEGFGDEVKRRIMLGTYVLSSGYYDAYYLKAMQARTLIKKDFDDAFAQVDVILSPSSPTVAHQIGGIADPLTAYLLDTYTIPVNLAGLPAISVPCGFADNLPVGLQLIGKPLGELDILRAGHAFEQNNDYHKCFAKLGGK